MSYQIQYSGQGRTSEGQRSRVPGLTFLFFLAFLIGTYYFWPSGKEAIFSFAHSSPWMTVQTAMEGAAQTLKQGGDILDAAACFAQEIGLYGG